MDPITALNESIPAIIETIVAQSSGKNYFDEYGAEKPEKIRAMTAELLDSMMGYLKTASLAHARRDMEEFQQNTRSEDFSVELKALWADIMAAAAQANPGIKNLLHQLWEVFDRLITECAH